MKAAGRSAPAVAVIVGEDEAAAGTVTVRDLARRRAVPAHRRPRRGGRRRPEGAPVTEPADPTTADERRRRPTGPGACAPTAAASCGPPTSVGPWPCAGGSTAAASTASTWPSSTCATAPASCSAWSTAPPTCAASTWCAVTGTVRPRPEGTVNAEPADRRGRGGGVRGRGPQRRRAAAVPARRAASTSTRCCASRHRYVDLRATADAAQPADAGHGQQRPPPVDGRRRASSRSRPRC